MLQEFCFSIGGVERRLLYPPSRPMVATIRDVFEQQVYPFLPFLNPAKVIVDVGANVGFTSVLFSALYPEAQIFAFEPGREAFEHLSENTKNDSRIKTFPYGLLDVAGRRTLYHGEESLATNSLLLSNHNQMIGEEVDIRCAATVFEELSLREISLLKIDTEGAEVPILRSLARLLTFPTAVMLEYHSEQDRQTIDDILRNTHILYAAHARQPHRGTVAYVDRQTVLNQTEFHRLAIKSG